MYKQSDPLQFWIENLHLGSSHNLSRRSGWMRRHIECSIPDWKPLPILHRIPPNNDAQRTHQ